MKYFCILFSLVFVLNGCTSENLDIDLSEVNYWSQEELNQYRMQLLNTTVLEGDVYFGQGIEDISSFKNIEVIKGQLRIQYSELTHLKGLENLRKVNRLKIDFNDLLEEITLPNLEEIQKNLILVGNNKCTIARFSNLKNIIDGGIGISGHEELKRVDFPSLLDCKGITIKDNPLFESLRGLEYVGFTPFSLYFVHLEFSNMNCPNTLFSNVKEMMDFNITIKDIKNSNLDWIFNLTSGTKITFKGDYEVEDFCAIKEAILVDNPTLVKVIRNHELSAYLTGEDIIEACQ